MINQFRSLNPFNLVLLFIITCLLRIVVLVRMPDVIDLSLLDTYGGMLVSIPNDLFSPFGNIFVATVLVFIQAILINRIVNDHNLMGKPTFLPALMFVTVSAVLEPFIVLSPALLANFFILWMFYKSLSLYRRDGAIAPMFDLGMIVALGTLVYFPFIGMLPMLWVILMLYRPFYWREWIASLVGFATVAFMVCSIYYYNDKLGLFFATIPSAVVLHLGPRVNLYDYIVLIPVALVLFFAVVSMRKKYFRSNVFLRKASFLLLIFFVFAILSYSVNRRYDLYHFIIAVPSISVTMAYYYVNAQKKWLYESLYMLLAIFIMYFQFV